MKNTSAALPHGWSEATLDDLLIRIVGGGTPPRNIGAYFDGTIPWFTVKDMKFPRPGDAKEHISDEAMLHSATHLIEPDTLIIATRIALGKAIMPTIRCAINQDLKALYFGSDVSPQFMLYWVMASEQMIQSRGSGTTVMGIRLEHVKEFPLAVPPAKEQTRIVDKLEELLSDLDAGVAELKAAQRKLAQYRQSLLKAAMEGVLTADWRASRTSSNELRETGADLLQRILTERRARWEAKQLAKFAEQGKTPPRGWQAKYPEPIGPSTANLEKLPAGWSWATLDQVVAESLIGLDRGHDHQSRISGNAGYVKMNNISMDGDVDTSAIVRIEASKEEIVRYSLVSGDLLFNTRNSRELVGKTGIVREADKATVYNNNLMRLRFDGAVTSEFLCSQMCAPEFRRRMERVKKATTSVAAIYAKDLFPLPVAMPPMDEQIAIGDMLATYLKAIDEQSAAVSKGLNQAAAQRKNILKAAFAGRLVPQDPNDEPASVLLERILAERAQLSAARGVQRTGSNRAPTTSSPGQSKRGRRPRTTA